MLLVVCVDSTKTHIIAVSACLEIASNFVYDRNPLVCAYLGKKFEQAAAERQRRDLLKMAMVEAEEGIGLQMESWSKPVPLGTNCK